ncbi:IS6 family transposase [Acetobacter thailandicus]|nr:IS6 family transposase [Acetobacter thailandicus]
MKVCSVSYKLHRFPLSYRLTEEMLRARGLMVSYETIRRWSDKFGPAYAARLRRKSAKPGDIWHLDGVHLRIQWQVYWLWRAVDQEGYVLDEILQTRRNAKVAQRLLRSLLHKQGAKPARIVTDKRSSYATAKRRHVMPSVRHLTRKRLNNRAENAHLPLRKREKVMQKFRSSGGCQLFASMLSAVRNLFALPA